MNKELNALKIGIPKLKKLYENNAKKMGKNDILGFDLTFAYLDRVLQYLEAIENANPSEALERTSSEIIDGYPTGNIYVGMTWEEHSAIKNTLIKAQEQEKVLEILKPLCEIVETPVKKFRYLKMNGVVVYTFKNQEEFDTLKRYTNE